MIEAYTDFFTLSGGDLARQSQVLRDFIGAQASGVAVIDLRESGPQCPKPADIADVNNWERALRLIERSPATTVALLAQQIGNYPLEVGLACDFRIAKPDTEVIWRNDGAVWPSTVLFRLVQLIGPARTKRLTVLGEPINARAALACGLIDILTNDPVQEVDRLRATVTGLDDLRVVRQLIAEATHTSYDEALGAHLAACDRYLRRRND
jgi:isomerase DpgB